MPRSGRSRREPRVTARHPVEAVELEPEPERSNEPGMTFDIGLGVRKSDDALAQTLERVLAKERPAIDEILHDYGVPRA